MDRPELYSQNLLRTLNYDQYLCNLYLTEKCRQSAMVLDAFDAEIRRIPGLVTEPMPGEIRLQWWRDVIAGKRDSEAKSNPLASGLIDVLKQHGMPVEALDRYLHARVFDLYNDPMPDMGTFEGYCGETSAVFFQLKYAAMGETPASSTADLFGHAGMAHAITQILGSIPFHNTSSRIYLPVSLLEASGITRETWLAGLEGEPTVTVITHMIELARKYQSRANEEAVSISKAARAVLLPLTLDLAYLDLMDRDKLVATKQAINLNGIKKHWILWRAARNIGR